MSRNYLDQQALDPTEEGNFEMFHQFIGVLREPRKYIDNYKKILCTSQDLEEVTIHSNN